MNLTNIRFRPVARLEFLPEEVEALYKAAESHYDAHCRSTVIPGERLNQRGLLTAMRSRIKNGMMHTSRQIIDGVPFPVDVVDIELEFADVDTLTKIAESPACPSPLYGKLSTVLRHMNQAAREVSEYGRIPAKMLNGDFT